MTSPTGHKPQTRQRSPWVLIDEEHRLPGLPRPAAMWERNVHDGTLLAYVDLDPTGGRHISISHRGHGRRRVRGARYPTWDEIVHARTELIGDVAMIMRLPVEAAYVALHDTTFHLHEVMEASDG